MVALTRFCPKAYVSSIFEIKPQFFQEREISAIILDLDNTIVPWKGKTIAPEVVELLRSFRLSGLRLCVVSNALPRRVREVLEPLGIPGISKARKPRGKPYRQALRMLGATPRETAVIGDQVFTDIWGGNRQGIFTVLVTPLSRKEFVGTKLVRVLEGMLLNRLFDKGIIDNPLRGPKGRTVHRDNG